jgi:dCMP deaminase
MDSSISKWDGRFLALAEHISQWSKDPSTQTGAVIVRPDRTIAALGYNGFPRGMDDDPELYADREVKYERVVHCEMNAVLSAGGPVRGCTLYTYPFLSCPRCAVHMIQAGIKRVVAPDLELCVHLPGGLDRWNRWKDQLGRTKAMFKEAGVEVWEYGPSGW